MRKSGTKAKRRSVPSRITNTASFAFAFLIEAIESSQVRTGAPRSSLLLIKTREHILSVHPTPSSLMVRLVPSADTTLAIIPDRCPCTCIGRLAPPLLKAGSNRTAAIQPIRIIFILLAFLYYRSLRTALMSASYSPLLQRPTWVAAMRPDLSMMSVVGSEIAPYA